MTDNKWRIPNDDAVSPSDIHPESDLRDADLSDADLVNADLSDADLLNADLSDADLLKADLSNASLGLADLSDASFKGSNLSNAFLGEVDLSDASLKKADLSNAYLKKADLSDANLQEADLSDANLQEADLSDVDLERADLSGAFLLGADLSDAFLGMTDLSDSLLRKADLSDAFLRKADLSDAELVKANLSNADLREADLSGTNLESADLSDADISESTFTNVDIRKTLLSTSDLFGSVPQIINSSLPDDASINWREAPISDGFTLRGDPKTTLVEADLRRADLQEADLGFAELREATLTSSDCENTQFDDANLNRATLENADLTGADLSQAYLYQTRLDGAQINEETQFHPDGDVGDLSTPNGCRYDSAMFPDRANASVEKQATTYIDKNTEVIRARRARSTYTRLEVLASENGFPNLKSEMFIRRQDARRELLFAQGQRLKGTFAQLQKWLFNYGESFGRIVTVSAGIMIFFWGLFLITGLFETDSGEIILIAKVTNNPGLIWDTFYHSVSVFFVGSGPLTPTNRIGELLIAAERIAGPILLALLIFVLGRRAAR